jgi:hypothetical protein
MYNVLSGSKDVYSSHRSDEISFFKIFTNLTFTENRLSVNLFQELKTSKQRQKFLSDFDLDNEISTPLYDFQISEIESIDSINNELSNSGIEYTKSSFSKSESLPNYSNKLNKLKQYHELPRFKAIQRHKFNKFTGFSKLKRIEISNTERTRRALSESGIKTSKEKKNYRLHNTGISLPWYDNSLRSTINSACSTSLPDLQPIPSRREVETSDQDCLKAYIRSGRRIRKRFLTGFISASSLAANNIGLFSSNKISLFKPSSVLEAVEYTTKSTNSGTPFLFKKNTEYNVSWVKRLLRKMLRNPNPFDLFSPDNLSSLELSNLSNENIVFLLPKVIFHRFQIAVDDVANYSSVKIRQVWCVPHLIVALEAYFFKSFIENCKFFSNNKDDYPYSIGLKNRLIANRNIRRIRRRLEMSEHSSIYSLDYSKFDRTIPIWAIDIFFHFCRNSLDLTHNESKLFELLRIYVKYSPVSYQNKIVFKQIGISSGLLITNLIDTFFNLCLIYYSDLIQQVYPKLFSQVIHSNLDIVSSKFKFADINKILLPKTSYCFCLGDDAILLCSISKIEFIQKVCSSIGMKLNIKHITHSHKEDIFYLGRYWDYSNIPFQTDSYIYSHLVFRERYYNESELEYPISKLTANRILSICLPLKNGLSFMTNYLKELPELQTFFKCKSDFQFYSNKTWQEDFDLPKSFNFNTYDPLDY